MPTHSVFKRFKQLFSRSRRPVEPTASALSGNACQSTVEAGTTSDTPTGTVDVAQENTATLIDQATDAQETASRLSARAANAVERAPDVWSAAESTARLLEDVLSGLKVFSRVLDGIGGLHPYVQAVTSIINGAIAKPIVAQDARDEAFEGLLRDMIRTYELVKKELHEDKGSSGKPAGYQTKLLVKISQETENCARFIKDEYIAQGFWTRATKNVLRGGEVDDRIQHFKNIFSELRENWRDEKLTYLEASATLDKLARVRNAGHTTDKSCLSDTRVDLLRKISEWVDDPAGPSALYLVGVAGSGKSSVAHTVAAQMHAKGRLGAFFAFDRSETDRVPSRVLGTIAYNLANMDENYRHALMRELRAEPKLADTTDLSMQWNKLILEPAQLLLLDAPLLIAIDAFDECSVPHDDPARSCLLRILTSDVLALPRCLRVLVTSRAEADIIDATSSEHRLDMADFMADSDVCLYVRDKLPRPDKGLDDSECAELAAAAGGLFQWAATACAFLMQRSGGTTMSETFQAYRKQLMAGNVQLNYGRPSLSALYSMVLHAAFDAENVLAMANFRAVMSLMLCARSPLSIDALHSIYSLAKDSEKSPVRNVLGNMGVVLQGTSSPNSPVRPMHASFYDFLTSTPAHPWHISEEDLKLADMTMALGTTRVLARDLTFNMLHLESSCVGNGDIVDLSLRLSKVPGAVLYSAMNFHDHIFSCTWKLPAEYALLSVQLRPAARNILITKFLFWLELISVTHLSPGGFERVTRRVLSVVKRLFTDRASLELVSSALLFCNDNSILISNSVPHIYLSALPFSPADSLIRQHYLPRFSGLPTIHSTVPASPSSFTYVMWWPNIFSLNGFAHVTPLDIACVSDTVLIVGTDQGIVRLDLDDSPCDIPPPKHRGFVSSVAYSSKHHVIVSGHDKGTVCLRDPTTLNKRMRFNAAHFDRVTTVCFTPNEDYLLSCSRLTLRLWSVDDRGGLIPGPSMKGGNCIACSPDGRYVFCGRRNGTIEVVGLPAWRAVGEPLLCGSEVMSLLHLPKDNRLAAGLKDGRLQVWDTDARVLVRELFTCTAKDYYCASLASFPSSPTTHVIMTTSLRTCLWDSDFETLNLVGGGPLRGRYHLMTSPNGHSLYAWSRYGINAWRTESWLGTTPDRGNFESIAYSDDGRFIRTDVEVPVPASPVPASQCWDLQSGMPAPFPSDITWRHPVTIRADIRLAVTFDGEKVILHECIQEACTFAVLEGHEETVTAGDISPDGHYAATVSYGELCLWDLTNRTQIGETFDFHWLPSYLRCVSFSPDGREVVTGSWPCIYIVRIDQQPDDNISPDVYPGIRCLNFTPQPTIDPSTGMDYADASLRCTRPDVRLPCSIQPAEPGEPRNLRLFINCNHWAVDFADTHFGTEWTKCFKG